MMTVSSAARLGFVALACAACANLPEGRYVNVAELVGAGSLDEGDVLEGLQNHPPDGIFFVDYASYEPLALRVDKKRIESFYRRRGFFSARVTDVAVDEEEEQVRVRFFVEEGEPSLVESVDLEGAPDELAVRLKKEVEELRRSEPFRYDDYHAAKARLRGRLVAAGYAFAKVDGIAKVDRSEHRVRVRYLLEPGPRVRVRSIAVEGLVELPDSFVENRLDLGPGDFLRTEALDATRGRILATGLVESVRFRWDRSRPVEEVDLVVALSEGRKNEIRLGAGGGQSGGVYQVRTRAAYGRKSLFDPLLTFRTEVRPSYDIFPGTPEANGPSVEAILELERHDLFAPRLLGTAAVNYGLRQLEAYSSLGPIISAGLVRPFLSDRLRVGARLEYQHLGTNPRFEPPLSDEALASFGLVDPLRVLFAAPFFTYEGRDDPLNPRNGFVADLRFEAGYGLSGGLGTYLTVTPELRGYVPIFWRRLVGAARIRFSSALFTDTTLPITRRFFAGGPESQRGFARRRLAPRRATGTDDALPVGGEALLETSVELRLDVVRLFGQWFGLVLFLDGADATETLSDLDPTNLHWAAGGGLRYRTPVGPVRFDVGFRLNRRDELPPDGEYAIHFSLGEAF